MDVIDTVDIKHATVETAAPSSHTSVVVINITANLVEATSSYSQ